MKPIKYVFFGTPRVAAMVLKEFLDHDLVPQAVVTNPDRPTGRKLVMTAPPVKQLIIERGLADRVEILQPEKVSAIGDKLRRLAPDVFIVMAYAQIIPKSVLEIPARGAVGVHPSLLPKYRGPSPMPSAILGGEATTGVTLYVMDEKTDHGPTLAAAQIDLGDKDYLELEAALAKIGADLALKTVPAFLDGTITPQPQDHDQATFTEKFETTDGFVEFADLEKAVAGDLSQAERIWRMIRALNPEPGVWTMKGNVRIKLLEADLDGTTLVLHEIQRAGKTPERIGTPLP